MNSFRIADKHHENLEDSLNQSYQRSLKGFISMVNHSKESNVTQQMITPEVTFIVADRKIEKGEEIFIDYVQGITDQDKRDEMLKKWGIVEGEAGKAGVVEEKSGEDEIKRGEQEFAKKEAERKAAEIQIQKAKVEAEKLDEEMEVLGNMEGDARLMMKKIKEDQEYQNAQKMKEKAEEMAKTVEQRENYSDLAKAQLANEEAIQE
jgi:hypothetical protein